MPLTVELLGIRTRDGIAMVRCHLIFTGETDVPTSRPFLYCLATTLRISTSGSLIRSMLTSFYERTSYESKTHA